MKHAQLSISYAHANHILTTNFLSRDYHKDTGYMECLHGAMVVVLLHQDTAIPDITASLSDLEWSLNCDVNKSRVFTYVRVLFFYCR